MFYLLFGKYLIDQNLLTSAALNEIKDEILSSRLRLGIIAEAEGLLTKEQADRINHLQTIRDQRFGDIAIEEGYLTDDQVTYLLSLQGNTYLKFVQALTDRNLFTLEQINQLVVQYQNQYGFTTSQMVDLKSDDLNRLISVLIHINAPFYKDLIGLTIRNLVRFIDSDIMIVDCKLLNEYKFTNMAVQEIKGDHSILLGFSGEEQALLKIAATYADEDFSLLDADSYDAICEFMNCINGLFASKLSEEDIIVDMLPPTFYRNQTIKANDLAIISINLAGHSFDVVISIDTSIDFQ